MKKYILPLLGLLPLVASADQVEFSFRPEGATTMQRWGTGRAEHYDVAIRITDPQYVGWTVHYVEIPYFADNANDIKIWTSRELKTVTYGGEVFNQPDWTMNYGEACCGSITAPTPEIEIPEGGLYVGYSFTINGADLGSEVYEQPVTYFPTASPNPEGLYVRTSSTPDWESKAQRVGGVSAMKVVLQSPGQGGGGTGKTVRLGIKVDDIVYETTSQAKVYATLLNDDTLDLENVFIDYVVNGPNPAAATMDTDKKLFVPSAKKKDARVPVNFIVNVPKDGLGFKEGTVTVQRACGGYNESIYRSAPFTVVACTKTYQMRPVIEEYTGTWCGFCPRGIAAMKQMYYQMETAPWFIGLAYHKEMNDPMQWATDFPHQVTAYPASFLNRTKEIETTTASYTRNWLDRYEEYLFKSMAELTPYAEWEADGTAIHCSTKVDFGTDLDNADLRLCYILLADGLKGDGAKWMQANNYAGDTDVLAEDPSMSWWVDRSPMVDHMEYNDVAIYSPDLNGTPESVPAQVSSAQAVEHAFDIDPRQVHNLQGDALIQKADRLRLVVMLLDGQGRMINANMCDVVGGEGVTPLSIQAQTMTHQGQAIYFDLMGRRVASPAHGVFVKVQDGKAVKVKL